MSQGEPKAARFRDISLKRLDQMEGGNYASLNLTSVLYCDRTDAPEAVKMEVFHCPGTNKVPFDQAVRAKYEPLKKGDQFGVSPFFLCSKQERSEADDWLQPSWT